MSEPAFFELLRCPNSGQRLYFSEPSECSSDAIDGYLVTKDNKFRYGVENGIPRFVEKENYADNFGMQWNKFAKTQLDSFTGKPISAERFWKATGWAPKSLKGKWVLDVGCGAGRFAEIALAAGATVVALDYSTAVDACKNNLAGDGRLFVVQGDIYSLPFAEEAFDYVYSLGVLQHTPDVKSAFLSLPAMVKPGGKICVDFYWKRFRTMCHTKYLFRPLTTKIPQAVLFGWLQRNVPKLFRLSNVLGSVPIFGRYLRRLIPVANYTDIYPLNYEHQLQWSLLDTFDWFAPKFDNPQTEATIRSWFVLANLEEVDVIHAGHLAARSSKPSNQ